MYAAFALFLCCCLLNSPRTIRAEGKAPVLGAGFLPSIFRPDSRESFLRQVNFHHKREINTQINYVAQKISQLGRLDSVEAVAIARVIVLESRNQNIDPLFVAAVIKTESTFKTHATSGRGATGLMQLMPATGEHLLRNEGLVWEGLGTLRDPSTNIRLGIAYLKQLSASFRGNTEHALIAYNWGPGNLSRALKTQSSIPASTVKYARGVLKEHKSWSSDLKNQITQYRYMNLANVIG